MLLPLRQRSVTALFALALLTGAFGLPAEGAPTLGKYAKGCVINGVSHSNPAICRAVKAKEEAAAARPTLGKYAKGCVINGVSHSNATICRAVKEKQARQKADAAREQAEQERRDADKRARNEARREALKDAIVGLLKRAAER